jgi:site-specific recombinase XerD
VRLLGKGRKERVCPLWPETASALLRIIRAKSGEDLLFRNTRGAPLTRDGVAYLLRKYVPRHNTLPRYEGGESLHTSCDTVVPLPFCRRESMCR